MAFDRLKDEIDAMIGSLDDKPPHDKQELHQEIFEKLQQLKAFGMPLPQDLVDLEAVLSEELAAQDDDQSPGEATGGAEEPRLE